MTPDDEPTPTDDASDATVATSPDDEPTPTDDTTDATDATSPDEGVEAEGTLLEKSQATIDDAHEAVKKVAATDAIGEDATGAGDLPPFADSVDGVEKPDPDDA